jgi:hypothetical protein
LAVQVWKRTLSILYEDPLSGCALVALVAIAKILHDVVTDVVDVTNLQQQHAGTINMRVASLCQYQDEKEKRLHDIADHITAHITKYDYTPTLLWFPITQPFLSSINWYFAGGILYVIGIFFKGVAAKFGL